MLSLLMTPEYAPAEDRHELQRLLLRVAGGEREALAELYQRTRSAVYGLALSYLKNAHDAQDLTQDVYVQVWDCAEQYCPTGSPMGWLLAVCRNLCLMRLRREERHELQQLLIHIAGGEREALAELYQRTRSAVYGLALSYLKNAHDAQDLTQDVYVQAWDCAEQYRPTGSPMGWLLAVCRNLCLMRLRREERYAALSEEEWDAIPAQECGLDADERTLLQQALASLADEERRIVLLHAVTGMKHREIAALLELPLPTVLSKYHRALKKMRAYLEGDDAK